MEARHTPGPWRVETATDSFGWVNHAVNSGRDYGSEQNAANARLIAAAPETAAERDHLRAVNAEMMGALEQVPTVFGRGACNGYSYEDCASMEQLMKHIDTIIAKHRG